MAEMKFVSADAAFYILYIALIYIRQGGMCVRSETEDKMEEKRKIRRGDIYMAELPKETIGSVQAGTRPVLITQSNWMNDRAPTVLVATVTSVIKRLDLKTHVLLPKIAGLPKQSMVMTEQRYTLDKKSLKSYRCTLPDEVMKQVDRAIKHSESDKYYRKSQRKFGKKCRSLNNKKSSE